MTSLTKEQILGAPTKLKTKTIPVPEWGDGAEVTIHELSGDERDWFDQVMYDLQKKKDLRGVRANLVAMSLKMGFTEADVKQLGGKSAAAIDRIFEAAKKLSGIDVDTSDTSEEEAEKNSESGQTESSG